MLQLNTYSTLMSKLMHYAKNVTGNNSYWHKAKEDLQAIIAQVGPSTIFFNFISCWVILAWISWAFLWPSLWTHSTRNYAAKFSWKSTYLGLVFHWANRSFCQVLVKRVIRGFLALVQIWVCSSEKFNSLSQSC